MRAKGMYVKMRACARARVCVYSLYNKWFNCEYEVMKRRCNEDVLRVYMTYNKLDMGRIISSAGCTIG